MNISKLMETYNGDVINPTMLTGLFSSRSRAGQGRSPNNLPKPQFRVWCSYLCKQRFMERIHGALWKISASNYPRYSTPQRIGPVHTTGPRAEFFNRR